MSKLGFNLTEDQMFNEPSTLGLNTSVPSIGEASSGFQRGLPSMDYSQSPQQQFKGYQPQVQYQGGSYGALGSQIGGQFGPAGAAIGGVGGGALDIYMSYLEGEERKKAEKARLEEARRQQTRARKDAQRAGQVNQARYDDGFGLQMNQENRTQETYDINKKQVKADRLRMAMKNSMNDSAEMRDLFAKRGVV